MLNFWIVLGAVIWLYALSVLHRAKLAGLYFWVGSVGLFTLLAFTSRAYLVWFLSAVVTSVTGWWGNLVGIYTTSYLHNLIQIHNAHGLTLLFVDYECSGIIETLAYLSLLWFYPLYTRAAKVKLSVAGFAWIFGSNVVRLSLIATILYFTGPAAFFWVHSILGRLIFYVLVIILYYRVFTRPQFNLQDTPRFNYGGK